MTERWARYDTERNAIDNLEKMAYFLRCTASNLQDWKWVVICCHSAMYGFAVQVAKGSDDSSVVRTTKSGPKLITFGDALKICKLAIGGRDALVLNGSEEESITTLQKQFRDRFEHYNPGSWSIEVSGFPDHILNAVNVIERLAVEINFYTHVFDDERESLELTIGECRQLALERRDSYA